MNKPELTDEEEYAHDAITGKRGRRKILAALNKRKLSSRELDEVMLGE